MASLAWRKTSSFHPLFRQTFRSKSKSTEYAKTNHVFDVGLSWKNQDKLVDHLCDSIFYNDDNIVALNKPYGLPIQRPSTNNVDIGSMPFCEFSIAEVIPKLAERLGTPVLEMVHIPPRLCSGIFVVSKDRTVTKRLSEYFIKSRALKQLNLTYWAITNGIPLDLESKVDGFGVGRLKVGQWLMYEAKPITKGQIRKRRMVQSSIKAVCIDKNRNLDVALVELQTNVVVWDNLQLYMLKHFSPILGDNHYSSRMRTFMGTKVFKQDVSSCVPQQQELSKTLRDVLELNQNTIVPLHLHCGNIVLPNLNKKQRKKSPTLTLTVPPSQTFQDTLQKLELRHDSIFPVT